MTEILPGVFLLDPANPEMRYATNVILLRDAKGGGYTLLDTGLPKGMVPRDMVAEVEQFCRAQKVSPSAIRRILITHLHLDHTGNLKALQQRTGAKVYAHWLEAYFLAKDPVYKGPGMLPQEPVQVTETLKDGDTLDAFEGLVAYHTPGHTPGHLVFYAPTRKILFTGDAVMRQDGPLTVSAPQYTFSQQMAALSLRRLADLDVESVVTYHGEPILKDGRKHLRTASAEAYGGKYEN
jgi:glyoxylase-like metal-dependent hydrolase (beta-lactamase superfamily II)